MSATPYVPFYTSDFLGGTSGMTAATKGVYITLLCLMYEAEGPLPQKWDTLARRCGCPLPAFKRAVSDLQDDDKLETTKGGLWSKKCEKHITQRRERSDSAKASAKKRWEKSKQKQGSDDANAMPSQCYPEPEPYIRDTNVSLSCARKSKPKPERFDEFWDQYPHRGGAKKGRAAALEKYRRVIASGVSEQILITAAMKYATDRQVLEGYGKGPVPWLNQKGWEDEIEPQRVDRTEGRDPRRGGVHDGLLAGFANVANDGRGGHSADEPDDFSVDGSCDTSMDRGSSGNNAGTVFYLPDAG